MEKKLLKYLLCPITNSKLELFDFSSKMNKKLIDKGLLISKSKNKFYYPIINGIPRMLNDSIYNHWNLIKDHIISLPKDIKNDILIRYESKPNIKRDLKKTQESFSSEWDEIGDNSYAWGRSPDNRLNEFLNRMDVNFNQLKSKKIFDAGCGNGEVEIGLKSSGSEIFALDLSSSIDNVKNKLSKNILTNNTKIHFIQGDVLSPPFNNNSFDYVFSDGVIHHTRNVYEGLSQLTSKLKIGGKCFVFVYSHDYKNFLDKFLYNLFVIIRKITLKLPLNILHFVCYFLSPLHYILVRIFNFFYNKERFKYRTLKETEVSLFDSLSPVYDWRTSYVTLKKYFLKLGYTKISKTYFSHVGIGVLGVYKN